MDLLTEMRRYPRQEVFSAVMITPDGNRDSAMAMALDISAGGTRVGLLDDWRPAEGIPLSLSFLFDTDQPIVLQCRVIRVTVDHLAVEFEPAQEEHIQHLLDAVGTLH